MKGLINFVTAAALGLLCIAVAPVIIVLLIAIASVLSVCLFGITVIIMPFSIIYGVIKGIASSINKLFGHKKSVGNNDIERYDGYHVNADGVIDMFKTVK